MALPLMTCRRASSHGSAWRSSGDRSTRAAALPKVVSELIDESWLGVYSMPLAMALRWL